MRAAPASTRSTPASTPSTESTRTPETIRQQVTEALDDSAALRIIELPPEQRGKITHRSDPPEELEKWVDGASSVLEKIIKPGLLPQCHFEVREGRASYSLQMCSLDPSGGRTRMVDGRRLSLSTLHEMTHALENDHPGILTKTKAFLNLRAARNVYEEEGPNKGKPRQKMTDGWPTYEDEWADKGWESNYVGKEYPDATELLTMGIERLVEEPVRFAKRDPEFFEFLIKIFQQ